MRRSRADRNFNPTLVQLESSIQQAFILTQEHFNPTLVQLEYVQATALANLYPDFNPTLVQLEFTSIKRVWQYR